VPTHGRHLQTAIKLQAREAQPGQQYVLNRYKTKMVQLTVALIIFFFYKSVYNAYKLFLCELSLFVSG